MFRFSVLPLWKAFEWFHNASTLSYPLSSDLSTLSIIYCLNCQFLKGFCQLLIWSHWLKIYCFTALGNFSFEQKNVLTWDPQRLYFRVIHFLHKSMYFILCIKSRRKESTGFTCGVHGTKKVKNPWWKNFHLVIKQ